MARFIADEELNLELGNIFENAKYQLILISPYIKLHERLIASLKAKLSNPELEIIIVFGKNENDLSRSMKKMDFDFFKDFPNIEIRYEKRLHAKYYANDDNAIITSMNLYSYSQDNNIEAGVIINSKGLLGGLASIVTGSDDVDSSAYNYFQRMIEQSKLLFKKTPQYESKMFGLSDKYTTSIVEHDELSDFFDTKIKNVQEKLTSPKTENSKLDNQTDIRFLSTTALSKELGIGTKELFNKFESLNWITKENGEWTLTSIGLDKGAQTKKGQYGSYIAWPETIIKEIN